jgi:hypothetical protein
MNIRYHLSSFRCKKDHSADVSFQSRGAWDRFCCGLGIRAVRAGSIGRDRLRFGENTESPQSDAGGLGPRPLYEEITASWFQAGRPGPQAMAPLGNYSGTPQQSNWPSVTEWLPADFIGPFTGKQ